MSSNPTSPLVLGPLLRFVGRHEATVWVETADTAQVTIGLADREWTASTFVVEGRHYALVTATGLEPGATYEYTVRVDDDLVWPQPDSPFPPSTVTTLDPERPTSLAFGSCRTSVPHDAAFHASHGVDALRTFALALAEGEVARPDVLALLGDQVYADMTSPQMQEFISARRDLDEPPGEELKDYEEYAHLYTLAWSEPAIRWVLSTLPSAMIFDDHDIRDDWNTSWSWHEQINRTSWWHERLVAGLTSYWVYQHVGNLAPEERAEDPIWQLLEEGDGGHEVDLTEALRDLAERNDRNPEAYRWSYTRELGASRLVVLDSRAARVLEPDRRSMLDPDELAWLDAHLTGDVDHLFIGTSVPFLLPPGLHDAEAISESFAGPGRPRLLRRVTEAVRQAVDLEHWAAFQHGFTEVQDLVLSVAKGERGAPPSTITFLSGDVHHSYVAEITETGPGASRVVQAVCSPIRNPMPRSLRVLISLLATRLVRPMRWVAERTRVGAPSHPWQVTRGPWFENNLALATVRPDGLELGWVTGEVVGGDDARPRLRRVAGVDLAAAPTVTAGQAREPAGG